jgi:very-short-patch-repair endonuclease
MTKKERIHPSIRTRARELRQPQTPAERALWRRLRNRQLGPKFRRQHPIGRFIVDFYCAEARLATEIDGDSHAEQAKYDAQRTAWLAEQGTRVIRFTNRQVHQQIEAVLEAILNECQNPQADTSS